MRFTTIFSEWVFLGSCILLLLGLSTCATQAAVDVNSGELQASANIVIPNADSFGNLKGYSDFSFVSKASVSGGIEALYQARLLSDPWWESELPELQLVIYSYASQDAAEDAFAALSTLSGFSNGQKTMLSSDSHSLYYQSNFGGSGVDVFGTVTAEYKALHLIRRNGNVIFQASIFRTNGEQNDVNLQTYADAITHTDDVQAVLSDCIENAGLAINLLFPPSQAFWTSQSEKNSLDLSELYAVPTHGSVHLDVYVSDPSAATGTILDSSGLSTPTEGDLYLYINSAGSLFAGIYAPDFDADCDQEVGWYRLQSASTLYPYEWNSVDLHYGVGGFSLGLNGITEASCSVSQPRSANDLYLGDFPKDSLSESMIGTVNELSVDYSLTTSGQLWDEVLEQQLFLDLPDTDLDLPIFQYLKEKGVFLGSDGMLYPDAVLNRAEMVKILLRSFNRKPDTGTLVPFWDVPIDAWYRRYIAKAYTVGMVKGHDDGTFLPGHEINRAEFFTMLYRLNGSKRMTYEGTYSDVLEDDWFSNGAAYAAANGLVGAGSFYPSEQVTRREAARVLYAVLNE